MKKYILIGLIPVLALIALLVSQFFFRQNVNRRIAPIPTTTPTPIPTAPPLPIIKEGNREVVVGPQNSRIIVTINGLLSKISLEGVNENGTSGQVTVDATFEGQPIKFLAVLPDAAFIDDRGGEYQTMSFFEFTSTGPKPNLWVSCRPAFQTQTENFRCLALILKNGF